MTIAKVRAVDLLSDGRAVCVLLNNETSEKIFVERLLINEEATVSIIKKSKKFSSAKIVSIEKISQHRVDPPCPHYPSCGGCDFQHMRYDEQLAFKAKKIESAFKKNAKTQVNHPISITPSISTRYRNKIRLNISIHEGKSFIGYHKKSSKEIAVIKDCLLFKKDISLLLENLTDLIQTLSSEKNFYQEISLHYSEKNEKIHLHFFMKNILYENLKTIAEKLSLLHPEISSISTSLIGSNHIKSLYGQNLMEKNVLSAKIFYKPLSFLQTNDLIAENLYQKILNSLMEEDVVLELYSGVGSLSLNIAKKVSYVESVEIEAISDTLAKMSRKANDINNISFIRADAEKYFPEKQFSTLIVDPPRRGLSKKLIDLIKTLKVKKFLYVSCDENTLARDFNLLKDVYHIKKIEGFDMFPMTKHAELLTQLELNESLHL